MFAAMECAALLLLSPDARVALAGGLAPRVSDEVRTLLGRDITVYDEWCASRGLEKIAKEVFSGAGIHPWDRCGSVDLYLLIM